MNNLSAPPALLAAALLASLSAPFTARAQVFVGLTYTLPGLPVLADAAHESLLAGLSGPGTFIQMRPGEAPRTLNVNRTQNWTYSLSYFLNLPHGIDPDFSYLIDGGGVAATSTVPEPTSTAGFVALMLLTWKTLARRKALVTALLAPRV